MDGMVGCRPDRGTDQAQYDEPKLDIDLYPKVDHGVIAEKETANETFSLAISTK